MNKAILILLVAGLAFLGIGWAYDAAGRSADERLGAILPTLIGFLLLLADFVLLIVWLVQRRKRIETQDNPPDETRSV